ncbi:MAG TPA: phosphoglucosamine mutase, partial [Actinomycetales bacterium]
LHLGHAVGRVLRHRSAMRAPEAGGERRKAIGSRPTVLIGKDTRISGYMLESALEAGFASAGVDVLLTGPLPTPGVAYLTRALRLDLGVVISASHNPFADNGIKFFSARGRKLPDEWEAAVERALEAEVAWADSRTLGRARRVEDAAGRYIEFCQSTVGGEFTLRGLRIVVDGAHGAAYQVAPAVFHELGAEVISIGCSPDGFNINDGVGATAPAALVDAVLQHGAVFGVALDGDGDRVQIVDGAGRLYNGDELLAVLAFDRQEQGAPVPGVVGTQMTNLAVEQALVARGIQVVRAKVGDRYVLEELLKRGWALGGEGSGHLLDLDRHTTGDGIVSALLVLQAVVRSGRSLADWLAPVTLYPQTLLNVRVTGDATAADGLLAETRADVERELGAAGRVLIRPSGTEPVVRVMVEARDAALAQRSAERLAAVLRGG